MLFLGVRLNERRLQTVIKIGQKKCTIELYDMLSCIMIVRNWLWQKIEDIYSLGMLYI